MHPLLRRVLIVSLSLFLLLYVGFQAWRVMRPSIVTVRAQTQSVDDFIAGQGFVLHDEQLLTDSAKGIIDYALDDGERVDKNGVVARGYATAAQAENERLLRALDLTLAQLRSTTGVTGASAVDITALRSDISDRFFALLAAAHSAQLTGLSDTAADFTGLLNELQVVTGETQGFDARIAELQAERDKLAAAQTGSAGQVTSPISGYFVSHADGYEGAFDMKNILKITPDQVTRLLQMKPSAVQAVGKVVTSYEWYVAMRLSDEEAGRLKQGDTVRMRFPFVGGGDLPATISALNHGGDGSWAVVLRCDYMTSALSVLRSGDVHIVLGTYTGLKIDADDVVVKNGVKGVYIRDGSVARFRKLNPVYYGDGFLLSQPDPYDGSLLQVYDKIIVGGGDLTDGQVIH